MRCLTPLPDAGKKGKRPCARQTERVEDYSEDGKERTRRSFLEAKDVKTQRLQNDVRIFPRCQVIVKREEENDFKSDVWMYHAAFRRENPVCPHPSHIASPHDQVGSEGV